uniref:Uncharacterized protein n=1 Tax=Glossina pallidipes TaxID=7398 RepID=A0A1A9ZZI8_GLOPL
MEWNLEHSQRRSSAVINLNASQGNVEHLTFVNHTDCHCVKKSKQSAPEYALHYHQLNADGLENLWNRQYGPRSSLLLCRPSVMVLQPSYEYYMDLTESVQHQFLLFALHSLALGSSASLPSYENRLKLINLSSFPKKEKMFGMFLVVTLMKNALRMDEGHCWSMFPSISWLGFLGSTSPCI